MHRNVYSEINLHLTWHTKQNLPMLVDPIRDRLYRYLTHRVITTPNALLHAIGGIEDHVHLAVTVPPTVLVSDWVGRLKGASAHYINHDVARGCTLQWQEGYGVVSFGTRDLPWVVRYIQNQKEHHARGRTVERLERLGSWG